jgi:hypothetical protein
LTAAQRPVKRDHLLGLNHFPLPDRKISAFDRFDVIVLAPA